MKIKPVPFTTIASENCRRTPDMFLQNFYKLADKVKDKRLMPVRINGKGRFHLA